MIAELIEAVASLVEFAAEAAGIAIRDRGAGSRVGDRFRATRAMTMPAVFRPLTPDADRIDALIPAGSRWRVELAVPAPGHAVYLACLDPLDRLALAPSHRQRALSAGLWLEVSPALLRSHFQPLRRVP